MVGCAVTGINYWVVLVCYCGVVLGCIYDWDALLCEGLWHRDVSIRSVSVWYLNDGFESSRVDLLVP